ncbi:hypothetical protein JIX56_28180 [Streptomyces sp. CA-210063]|uniref:hypothetical protein n=1 Tax=Streptomyces sp. CA-210063 TaxID=2801029 RepID=UPI00214BCB3A|nr:hypothetical protein [Streptomyces sp. CA-210063]UUU33418.1 hypothetical protein JIX56_28180 [Streptomyces sp. CA-210063]
MTTVTLPTVPPPPESRGGTDPPPFPLPGRYAVAPDRSLVELTAWYGPLPTGRRRVTLTGASLTVPDGSEQPVFRFEFVGRAGARSVLVSEQVDSLDGGRRLRLLADLDVRGVAFPVLLWLRVVERGDDRLLVVGTARLPYRLLRRATGFRFGRLRPATRLRLLVAAEFA